MTTTPPIGARPLVLFLPRAHALRGLDIPRLARRQGDRRDPRQLEHRFGLHPHELRFVRALLREHSELWVFRCDQTTSAGDLVVVDMSTRQPRRSALVVELKQRTRVRACPRHVQLAGHPRAVRELITRQVLPDLPTVRALLGTPTPELVKAQLAESYVERLSARPASKKSGEINDRVIDDKGLKRR